MAELPISYNTETNKEGLNDFTAIPAGPYPMQIVKSEYKPTKAKNGHYLSVQFKVLHGKHKGKLIFENLNLDNPNPIAVEIANKSLNSICQACDKVGVKNSEELHGIPMIVTVKVQPATATHPASNAITGYKPYSGEEIIDDSPEPTSTETGDATTGKKKLPWEK